MFTQNHASHGRERSLSRSKGSTGSELTGTRITRERSSSASSGRDQYTKRSSIFSKRPKSILTTTSNDSSTRSIASNSSGSDLSRLSPSADALSRPVEADVPKSRFNFGRGIKNRMSARIAPSAFESSRMVSDQRRSAVGGELRISAPFDFQHVGKIEEPQNIGVNTSEVYHNFRTLSKRHRNAVIASVPDEETQEGEDSDLSSRPRKPAPLRPRRPDDLWGNEPATAPLPERRAMHQPATHVDQTWVPHTADFRGPMLHRRVPTRTSSIFAQPLANGPGPTLDATMNPRSSQAMDDQDPFIPLYDSQPPGWIENSLPLLHTVSPMDTFSDNIRTPAFHPPLEQVPEEPEGGFSNRPSRDLPRRPSLRHSKSTPIIANRFRSSIDPFVDSFPLPAGAAQNERPVSQCSQGSDTLGNSPRSFWQEAKTKAKARSLDFNEPDKTSEPTWEDYIEYCYEHNAEADCEFDWHETSHFDDNDSEASGAWSEQYSPFNSTLSPKLEDSRSMKSSASHALSMTSGKSDRMTSHSSVPELDYRFSRATSTASLSIATPRDGSLYRISDVPPLPNDLHNMKDAWEGHFAGGEHLYNEIMVGGTAVVPDSPQHPEDRPQTILYTGNELPNHPNKALPTPPSSNDMPHELSARKIGKLLGSEAAQHVRVRKELKVEDDIEDDLPPAVPSKAEFAASQPPSKAWPLEDDFKMPTSPASPTPNNPEDVHSFFNTPSPKTLPDVRPSRSERRSSSKAPIHISFPSIDLPPLTLPNATPQPSNFSRIRAGSVADRIGPLPNNSPKRIETPGTPDSATSAPEGLGRMGYSLFPSKKASMNSLNGPPLPSAPTSAPMAMSEPSLTRPVSRAASQASSSRSSTRALSMKSKSSKKANAYQERFPLGI